MKMVKGLSVSILALMMVLFSMVAMAVDFDSSKHGEWVCTDDSAGLTLQQVAERLGTGNSYDLMILNNIPGNFITRTGDVLQYTLLKKASDVGEQNFSIFTATTQKTLQQVAEASGVYSQAKIVEWNNIPSDLVASFVVESGFQFNIDEDYEAKSGLVETIVFNSEKPKVAVEAPVIKADDSESVTALQAAEVAESFAGDAALSAEKAEKSVKWMKEVTSQLEDTLEKQNEAVISAETQENEISEGKVVAIDERITAIEENMPGSPVWALILALIAIMISVVALMKGDAKKEKE